MVHILFFHELQVEHFLNAWPWIEEVLLPNLYYTKNYNGAAASDYDKRFISDGLAIRFGPPRLRQLRVTPGISTLLLEYYIQLASDVFNPLMFSC